ncbi:MAG TPA: alpha/beta fold hydrolase [Candidatus Saccharimonadales bacterium]|nr:alpha/beta fold hydrolase [Candidatus Saccharimonadales bacterium]
MTIKNRQGLKLVIQVDTPNNPQKLVFIMHGLGGFMRQMHIEGYAEIFLKNDFRVVRFDATNSIGDSEGDMMNVSYDNYVADLEDVISWARQQSWFKEPFSLCGHSMGAQTTTWYAENHPAQIKYLAPFAPPVNYELWSSTFEPGQFEAWKEKGYREERSRSKPGVIGRTGWGFTESIKKYDLLPAADKLTMPVLFMAGESDKPCPIKNQEILFEKIPSQNKKFVKITGAEHSLRNNQTQEYGRELQEAKTALDDWLKSLK